MSNTTLRAIVCVGIAIATLAAHVGPARADASEPVVETIAGSTVIAGQPAEIEVVYARARDADPAIPERALAAAGAGVTPPSADFLFSGHLWEQFLDHGRANDELLQSYNPNGDPTGAGLAALRSAQASWSRVPGSPFAFRLAGPTARCPSLALDCPVDEHLDGTNDVGWLAVTWDDPSFFTVLGYAVTWYDAFTGAAIESDVVLNADIAPLTWQTDGRDVDVESVLLHELGHVLGLEHSYDPETVMFPALSGTRRELSTAELDAVRALYPKRPSTVTDRPSAHDFTIVAERGTPAPGGGTYAGAFELGAVNARGDTAFVTDVSEGQAMFVAGRAGTRQVVRSGQTVAGLALGIGSSNAVAINDAGEVAFAWFLDPFDPEAPRCALFRADARGSIVALVTPEVTPAPGGGVFLEAVNAELSDRGDIAFGGFVAAHSGERAGIYVVRRNGAIEAVAQPGDQAPGGGTFTSFFLAPSISGKGDVAFTARTTAARGYGAYVRSRAGELRAVARPGDPAPGGSVFLDVRSPSVNSRGEVAFAAMVARPGRTVYAPYLATPAGIAPLAELGSVMPDGWLFGGLVLPSNPVSLNERGDVAFVSQTETPPNALPSGPSVVVTSTAVYASSHDQLRYVAREGSVLLGFGWIWSVTPQFFSVQIDDGGEVVFQARTEVGRLALLRAGRRA